jgi:Holliday junction resolvasome RuvABC ATP-dependent DNA helicase subunit
MAVPPRKSSSVVLSTGENASAQGENPGPRSFAELVGQSEAVRRLTALVELARRRGEVFGHTLLLAPDGYGKRTIAHLIARELGVNLRENDCSRIERAGDLASVINDLEKGDVLLLLNVNRLRRYLVEILPLALKNFELDIVVGKGPGARTMRLAVKPFTLIGTAQKEADCPQDLLNSVDVVIPLQRYREAEMLELTERFAKQAGVSVEPPAAALVARLAEGNPGRAESLMRRLRLVEKQPVGESDAQEMLSVFGYKGGTSAPNPNGAPTDWASLSGIEFERLNSGATKQHGFCRRDDEGERRRGRRYRSNSRPPDSGRALSHSVQKIPTGHSGG